MEHKKEEKKKEPGREKNSAAPNNTAASPAPSDQPDLSHLSGDWQQFYRLVIDQLR